MTTRTAASIVLVLLATALAGLAAVMRPDPAAPIAAAANRFLDSLSPDLRTKAALEYDVPARKDWHFVPRDRPGVLFKEMNDEQRIAARDLLRSALSSQGMSKIDGIMQLDAVLRDTERARGGDGASRDPQRYAIAIYGRPGTVPWGWKVEGHHISLNFSIPRDGTVCVTPSFLGANPAKVQAGPLAGVRVLADEEDRARMFMDSLTPEQRKQAVIDAPVPPDIILAPGATRDLGAPVGLPWTQMTGVQQNLLEDLIYVYHSNLADDLLGNEYVRVGVAEQSAITFAWVGSLERGEAHYYRIHHPKWVIEYDNTQDGANHIHTVWHDLQRNFGGDPLREHLEKDHR